MTQIRRRIGDYASSKFLNSQDVIGQEGPAVITSVTEREVRDEKAAGGKRLALMIEFDRWPDKGYDCNQTNIRVLQDMLGEDASPDDLRGVRLWITTHDTNFGRGILLQPPQDSMQHASAAARQKIADARARTNAAEAPSSRFVQQAPLVELLLVHSHSRGSECNAKYCDVSRAIQLGHTVVESWPEEAAKPASAAAFEPRFQVEGSVPQARRVPSSQPPGDYHPDDPGPSGVGPFAEEDIPF